MVLKRRQKIARLEVAHSHVAVQLSLCQEIMLNSVIPTRLTGGHCCELPSHSFCAMWRTP